jgi:AMP nucleosidase
MPDVFRIAPQPSDELPQQLDQACDFMEATYREGRYAKVTVLRHWSKYNPTISGKIARPTAYRWYLRRELLKLAKKGAEIEITPSQPRIDLASPSLLSAIDESDFDQTRKKVFLFGPERVELSLERLEHYTGTRAEDFQRYVLLTNYHMHMVAFEQLHPDAVISNRTDVQMPTMHHLASDNNGLTIINIGVGPSNAKNLTDHLAVLRPDAMLMVGHCAGIRNHQEIGDFVLASGYMRDDHVLDDALPQSVPVTPSFLLNRNLARVLEEHSLPYRIGVVYTTADRNWELAISRKLADLKASRSIGVDMESATVAANGFRYRIPSASLLCISDKPLHGSPKLPKSANEFYQATKSQHLQIAEAAFSITRSMYPDGLPTSDIRAMDEPLLGGNEH